jgi:hypothetical protein
VKLLLSAVAAAVLLLTAGTIWLGTRTSEDTVVAHPYEEGLAYHHAGGPETARPPSPPARSGEGSSASPSAREAAAEPAADCDLGARACTLALADLELTLEVTPRPPRAMADLAVQGRLSRGGLPLDGAEVALSFAMPRMQMGENVSRLAGAGGGRYQGKAVLVRCHSGRRDWVVTAAVRQGGEERRARFVLTLGE